MRINFRPYRRRDGSWMMYLNNDRGVSVAVSPEHGFGPSTKLTKGQGRLIDAALAAFRAHARPFTGDLAAHSEPMSECGPYALAITDVASVGGMNVGADGAYVVRESMILPTDRWYEIDD